MCFIKGSTLKVFILFLILTFSIQVFSDFRENPTNLEQISPRKNLAYLSKNDSSIRVSDFSQKRSGIIDIHEHVLNEQDALKLLGVMDDYGISKTCLVSSSKFTFTLNDKHGFEEFKNNNETLLSIKRKYPNRFCVFVTIDPLDTDNLNLLKSYMDKGADGLKLYLGHGGKTGSGPFHSMLLDDERMLPIYKYLEKQSIPVIMHVNLIKYYNEFTSVMDKYPKLKVNIPHFGLHKNTAKRLKRLADLFDRYPNLYSDISFGWYTFHISGFEALAKWRSRSNRFLTKYADRFMFATDMVLEPTKDEAYIKNTVSSYMQLLETKNFRFFYEPEYPMHGLDLNEVTLKKIYETTPTSFLYK